MSCFKILSLKVKTAIPKGHAYDQGGLKCYADEYGWQKRELFLSFSPSVYG